MAITENAKQYHKKMFPGYESGFLETDPEFIELFDNFAFDEVVNSNDLDGRTRQDPARMAARIIESVDQIPAPLRMVLGSQALASTISTLRVRVADYETHTGLAASTDFPAGE